MPYASERQRRFMYSQHPDIAARWDREGENRIVGRKSRSTKRKGRRSGR